VTDQRRHPRFELRLPFEIIRAGTQVINRTGETRNVSSAGVLFTTDAPIQVGDVIEYILTLPPSTSSGEEVRLRCLGKIVREQGPETFAATLERYEFVRPEYARSAAV
jgi:hypothetical protein